MKSVNLLIASIALCGGNLYAGTLSTLSLADAGYDVISYNSWSGQAFTLTTTAETGKITQASFQLEIVVPNRNLIVRIVGATPGTAAPDMSNVYSQLNPTNPDAGVTLQAVLFEPDSSFCNKDLTADATYWVLLGMTGEDLDQTSPSGIVRWHYGSTAGQNPDGPSGWNVSALTAASGTGGINWSTATNTPYLFAASVTVVPEPGHTALFLSAGFLALLRRRP